MIRRLIKQGNNSYTLTLPIKWIRQNNLIGNEEIYIDETENELNIHANAKYQKKSITLNVSENNEKSIRFLIQQIYRQNYDSFILNYKTEETFKTINKIIDNYFVGMEITEKQNNKCAISVIVETTEEKFHLFLRKMFLLIIDSLNSLKTKDRKSIHYNYLKIYSYENYCKRYIYSKKTELNSYDYYSLLSYIVNMSSDINQLSKYNYKLDKSFDRLIAFFEKVERDFYSKKIDSLMNMPEDVKNIKISKEDFLAFHYQMEISRLIYGAVSPLLGILLYETGKSKFDNPIL